jgi:very-short-patch-repair endonuclease
MIEQIISKFTGENFVKEYRFHGTRKFRFDLACIDKKLAIEIEGGIFTQGRHTRGKGYLGDMEKYNLATENGWSILRYSPMQILKTETLEQIKRTLQHR